VLLWLLSAHPYCYSQRTATHYCNTRLQHSTATHDCNTVLQHTTATQYCNTRLQHICTADLLLLLPHHCNTQLQLPTATHFCNTCPQHTPAAHRRNTRLQHTTATHLHSRALTITFCKLFLSILPAFYFGIRLFTTLRNLMQKKFERIQLKFREKKLEFGRGFQIADGRRALNIRRHDYSLDAPHTTATRYCDTLLQYTTATRYYNTLLQHATATHYCNTILQHATATRYCDTLLQHATATRYCNTLL